MMSIVALPIRGSFPTAPTRVTGETILWVTVAAPAPRSICSLSWECVRKPIAPASPTITHKSTSRPCSSTGLTPLEAVGTKQLIISFANPYLNLNKPYLSVMWGGIMGKLFSTNTLTGSDVMCDALLNSCMLFNR